MWLGAALIVALGLPASAPGASTELCASWPGEPNPLPQLTDPDPVLARWAELRAAELAERAKALEEADSVQAHSLWLRFRCFDPGSPELRRALHRTRPIHVHRPDVAHASPGQEIALEGWQVLGQPVLISRVRERASDIELQRTRLLAGVDRWIRATEDSVGAARFDEALASAGQARTRLMRMRQASDLHARWIRLELAEATVHVARGSDVDAAACAERALARQPGLDLDASRYSPKLVRLFESARVAGRP